jgi:acetolactate synthase-1/2/3 large subunit
MKASDLFVRCLEEEGVQYIFGVPGEENADFMISLEQSTKIHFVLTRHEQGAAFMAEAYGRLTGNPAGCLGTLGPGATNLITGVADADMDHAPMLVLTGQGSTRRLHKESHQVMDVVGMFEPVTKWAASVRHPENIPEMVRKAVRVARTEKPGAVLIELPEDLAKLQTDGKPLPVTRFPARGYRRQDSRSRIRPAADRQASRDHRGQRLHPSQSQQTTAVTVRENRHRLWVSTFMAKGCVDMDAEYCLLP